MLNNIKYDKIPEQTLAQTLPICSFLVSPRSRCIPRNFEKLTSSRVKSSNKMAGPHWLPAVRKAKFKRWYLKSLL
ncbi:hypothetical protein J6590_106294 [Homalodisca vitripennis]|nr:hypothetical protein J6590_106294 [Homalodisca vitripennis]